MKRRIVMVIDVDDERDTVLPITPAKVQAFLDDVPEGVEVVLVKVDGVTLHEGR